MVIKLAETITTIHWKSEVTRTPIMLFGANIPDITPIPKIITITITASPHISLDIAFVSKNDCLMDIVSSNAMDGRTNPARKNK